MKLLDRWDQLIVPSSPTSFTYALESPQGLRERQQIQEQEQRSLLISRFVLVVLILLVLGLPSTLMQSNTLIRVTTLLSLLLYGGVIVLTKKRRITLAGICFVGGLILGIMSPLLLQAQLTEGTLGIYYIFTVIEIVACAILPPVLIVPVVTFNIAVMVASLLLQPKGGELAHRVSHDLVGVLTPPILLYVNVAIVMYFLLKALRTTQRGKMQAEQLAKLEQQLAQENQIKAANAEQLNATIQHIVEVHARVANGDWEARVAVHHTHVLWEIAIPLNNLLNRAAQWKREAETLRQLQAQGQAPLITHPMTQSASGTRHQAHTPR